MNNNQIRIGGFGSANNLTISQEILFPVLISEVGKSFKSPEMLSNVKICNLITKFYSGKIKIKNVTSKTDIW